MSRCTSGRCSCEEDRHFVVSAIDHFYIYCLDCGTVPGRPDRACFVVGNLHTGTFSGPYFGYFRAVERWPRSMAGLRAEHVGKLKARAPPDGVLFGIDRVGLVPKLEGDP